MPSTPRSLQTNLRTLALAAFATGCVAPLASGCSSAPTDSEGAAESASAVTQHVAESSYVSTAVLASLQQSPSMQGVTWNVSHDNTFDSNWLINSPVQPMWGQATSSLIYPKACTTNCEPDFGLQLCKTQSDCTGGGTCKPALSSVKHAGQAPESMCVGHSFDLVERYYGLISSAQSFVDITSLSPADTQFRAAIRNAVTLLSAKAAPPEVRIITAEIPVEGTVNTKTEVQDFTRDVPSSSNIKVAVGAYRSSDTSTSWNHSKMVAVDGKTAIVGGHNMWSAQYLGLDPVNDTSMEVHGTAAADAHRFANVLWNYTCTNESWVTWLTWSVWENEWVHGVVTNNCPAPFTAAPLAGPSTGTVISVGRLGTGIESNGNQADAARLALINSAKTSLRIVQQDIGPVTVPYLGLPIGAWPADELKALADALTRGVDVYVILSNLNATAGGLPATVATYSNGWTVTDVGNHIKSYMTSTAGYATGAALDRLLCTKLHMAPLRYNGTEATWPDGQQFANHSKIVEVDQQALFIASFNMYPANLQEFGYIVDDSLVTGSWLSSYWANAWKYSSTAAISGTEAKSCQL